MDKKKEISAQYYKDGKLIADTRNMKSKHIKLEPIDPKKEMVDPDIYDCPQCGKHSMETVQFATYGTSPNGEPGLLCWVCHHMLSGEKLEDYMTIEDDWREQ